SLKRSRHFAALAFAYLAILMSAENIKDLFAPSLVCIDIGDLIPEMIERHGKKLTNNTTHEQRS
ncbi:hypothetical protein Q4488_11590, partial [Amphritea sp. 1_MG-2023]|uniref:hypothetical protein n=1 Tax=Amphritea sp. 1_MG-2023 TaxID=3062670 RepID=UPI0026E20531